MSTARQIRFVVLTMSVLALAASVAFASPSGSSAAASPAAGWIRAGSAPADYDMGVDRAVSHGGKGSGFIRSNKPVTGGFGTLMQMFDAEKFHGKRLRLSAWVKNEGVSSWAGVWMRVDGRGKDMLAFDNMQSRPIKGSADWKKYEVVLDVAPEATAIAFGILLDGPGRAWIDDIALEAVDKSVPTTGAINGAGFSPAPQNLDFETK